jgi:sulfate transporter 4
LAIQAAMLVGSFYIVMGLLRLGFVTIFLSHAVISGFTSGAAVIIGLSQLKYILGYDIESSKELVPLLYNTLANIDQFNYKTFLMGLSGAICLLVMKHLGKTYKKLKWMRAMGPVTVSAVCILVTWGFSLDERGIPIVEYIPRGLPSVTVSSWSPLNAELLQTVLSMVIIGFMESIAIAKQLAAKHKYELDSSTELIGLGVANFLGAVFHSYPVTGSFSRSAVNNEAGAKSGISGIVTATMVMITLLFLTSIFEYMPLATLAAIVISGVLGLLDFEEAMYLWRVHKFDWLVWMVSFLGTMFLGVEVGLMIAVGLSLLLVLYESAYPHTAVLGRLPGATVYRNIKQYPEAEQYAGIVLCRVDAPIYFANTQYIRDKLHKYEALSARSSRLPIQFVIVDFSPVSYIDTSALHILEDLRQDYSSRGVTLCLCNPSRAVMHRLVLDGLADKIGHDNIFVSTHDAVREALSQISQSSDLDLEEQTTDRDDQQTRLALPNIPSDDFQPDATDVSQTEDNNAHAIVSN